MLKEYIEELVSEVLGSFNLSKFKAIAGTNNRDGLEVTDTGGDNRLETSPELTYAKQFLPKLGTGSSRATFALSGGKILKIALNPAGHGQNRTECNVWDKTNSIYITKVYDRSPNYKWIISELVKELKYSDFKARFGVAPKFFDELWEYKPKSIEQYKAKREELIKYYDERIERFKNKLVTYSLDPKDYNLPEQQEDLLKAKDKHEEYSQDIELSIWKKEECLKTLSPEILALVDGCIQLVNATGILWGDIEQRHLGRTVDGQIKLFDYGFDEEVRLAYYKPNP